MRPARPDKTDETGWMRSDRQDRTDETGQTRLDRRDPIYEPDRCIRKIRPGRADRRDRTDETPGKTRLDRRDRKDETRFPNAPPFGIDLNFFIAPLPISV
jgi:hypothetical protein